MRVLFNCGSESWRLTNIKRLERVEDNMIQTSTKTKGQVRITSRQFVPESDRQETKPAQQEPVAKIANAAKKKTSREDEQK